MFNFAMRWSIPVLPTGKRQIADSTLASNNHHSKQYATHVHALLTGKLSRMETI